MSDRFHTAAPQDALSLALRNWFGQDGVQRNTDRRLIKDLLQRSVADARAQFIVLIGARAMMVKDSGMPQIDPDAPYFRIALDQADSVVYLGHDRGIELFALCFDDDRSLPPALSDMLVAMELRQEAVRMGREGAALVGYATAMANWHRRHRFCGACGNATTPDSAGHVLVCSNCDQTHFPRTDPAVIVLVEHEDHCLLGRKPEWPAFRYSTLAGFVEPGETLEAAVVREVHEEAGVEVISADYHSSQPWPFPGTLMLGYHAVGRQRVVELRDGELAEAAWFSREDIVRGLSDGTFKPPTPISIAFRLLEDWFNRDGDDLSGILKENLAT